MTPSGSKRRITPPLVYSISYCRVLGFPASLISLVYVWGRGLRTAVALPSPLAPEPCITARIMGRTRFKCDKTVGSLAEP